LFPQLQEIELWTAHLIIFYFEGIQNLPGLDPW